MASSTLVTRTATNGSDDDVMGDGDPSDSTGLLMERLRAWKHMVGYLENYIAAMAKEQQSQAKDQEKILKTVSNPLKETHHFDQAMGGVVGLFQSLQTNTQAQAMLHQELAKNLYTATLPILERLHAEIKSKNKELLGGAAKGSKAVDSTRAASQKHIDLLGHNAAVFDSSGGKVEAKHDPYVLQRGLYHRLNKQILEENANRQDLIQVQNQFQQFEAHVVTTVQAAMNSFNQFMSGGADRQKAIYGDIAANAQSIPLDFEWNGFMKRNASVLVNPNAPPRTMSNISFPNQNHRATKPLIEGSLERKSRGGLGALKGYSTGYYAVTPAGYLHEYKDDDNFRKDPSPEVSLYLPDCVVGALDGPKFAVKGKDSSGGKMGQKLAISSDFNFKALTAGDAEQWYSIIRTQAGGASASMPTSPVESRNVSGFSAPPPVNTDVGSPQGVAGVPQSATSAKAPSPTVATTSPVTKTTSPIMKETNPGTQTTTSPITKTTSPITKPTSPTTTSPITKPTSILKTTTRTTGNSTGGFTGGTPAPRQVDNINPTGAGSHFRKG